MDYNFENAETIGKKSRALKHCNKILSEIDKTGKTIIKLNCTGVTFTVHKGDAVYLQLQATRAALIQDIGSYEIIQKSQARSLPAPVGAAPEQAVARPSDDELAELRREKHRQECKRYREKIKAQKLAAKLTPLTEG